MSLMAIGTERATWFAETFEALTANMERAVLGKRQVIRLTLVCLLAEGHLLLEDVPGRRQDVARPEPGRRAGTPCTASSSRRTCCRATSPGVTVYDQQTGTFDLPARVRSSATSCSPTRSTAPRRKTQSALLEVMEEGQVTVDGITHACRGRSW